MANYKVTLTHTEVIEVEAQNESEAIAKAYAAAEAQQVVWDEGEVEEIGEEDDK